MKAIDLLDRYPLYLILCDFVRNDLSETEEEELVATLLENGWIDMHAANESVEDYDQLVRNQREFNF